MQEGNHTKKEMLLWCIVSDNLKWRNHILDAEQPPLKLLTSRVNALSCPCSALRGTLEPSLWLPMVLWCPRSAIWSSCGEAVRVICSTPSRSILTRLPGWSQGHQGTRTHLPGGSYCQAVGSVSVQPQSWFTSNPYYLHSKLNWTWSTPTGLSSRQVGAYQARLHIQTQGWPSKEQLQMYKS